ncbi:MAG: hypothetical protein V4463_21735 [Pseudomonadota bacterium]
MHPVRLIESMVGLVALVAVLALFKPLLLGIVRATVLLVKPHQSKAEKAARRQMREAAMFQDMIASASSPSDAAELRAFAARV